ncbi:hypothetical protein K7W42_07555 [Deinococcus sp. HMF7604]|uniref:hypothetical protein n=1 Tax=Deinococcus betulae TaxID=2873312 RepID=UPI001CD027CE|nr:hypothetical protein [Deinococcus betulae]MBZ9750714.1 hypothetical protein [Deinococcus betulae]
MTFSSPALDRLRALQEAQAPAAPQPTPGAAPAVPPAPLTAAPLPSVPPVRHRPTSCPPAPPQAPTPRPPGRPSIEARAHMAGHCGTCRAFTLAPSEGRFMGVCSHGRGAFDAWARHSGPPVVIHEAARCMTEPFPRWALRSGVTAHPDTDMPRGGGA